jgi:hypothetical protein
MRITSAPEAAVAFDGQQALATRPHADAPRLTDQHPQRRRNMKTLIATVALATALVAPIFTQAATAAPNDVVVGGKSIGQDPDANVRLQMRRDAGSEGGF